MDYLVLKRIGSGDRAEDWQPVVIVRGVEDGGEEVAVKQGYTGDGRYKAVSWPEADGSEFDLLGGDPVVNPIPAEPEGE